MLKFKSVHIWYRDQSLKIKNTQHKSSDLIDDMNFKEVSFNRRYIYVIKQYIHIHVPLPGQMAGPNGLKLFVDNHG